MCSAALVQVLTECSGLDDYVVFYLRIEGFQ